MNEFEFLDRLRSRSSLTRSGDDCAVLPLNNINDLLITADMLVENVDFRMEWAIPEFLGHTALAVSLSDIAAMGGTPKWSMLSMGVPEHIWNSDFLDRFYEGWFALARKYNVELVGGDVSRVPGELVIDSIVGGEVAKGRAILRSTGRPGDAVFVSGDLGGAAGALKLLETGSQLEADTPALLEELLLKQLRPEPEVSVANLLQERGIVTSAIDISDGLSSDLGHICRESGVGAVIYAEKLPIDPLLTSHFTMEECRRFALHGGEDLRLLFTVDPKNISKLQNSGVEIGVLTVNVGNIELTDGDVTTALGPAGFRHF